MQSRNTIEEKNLQNQPQTIKKRTYISIITLNVNGLSVLTKRHRLAEWIKKKKKKKTHIYAVCKKPTSGLKTCID